MKDATLTATLKGAMSREGFTGVSFAKTIGMPYQTLRYRFRHPGTWHFYEWAAVQRHLRFHEAENEVIRKEITRL